jgi:hypothetical protein
VFANTSEEDERIDVPHKEAIGCLFFISIFNKP